VKTTAVVSSLLAPLPSVQVRASLAGIRVCGPGRSRQFRRVIQGREPQSDCAASHAISHEGCPTADGGVQRGGRG